MNDTLAAGERVTPPNAAVPGSSGGHANGNPNGSTDLGLLILAPLNTGITVAPGPSVNIGTGPSAAPTPSTAPVFPAFSLQPSAGVPYFIAAGGSVGISTSVDFVDISAPGATSSGPAFADVLLPGFDGVSGSSKPMTDAPAEGLATIDWGSGASAARVAIRPRPAARSGWMTS